LSEPTYKSTMEFFRHPTHNVGYLRSLKCASTFYTNIFKANGWIRQGIDDIDWARDDVFSFIIHPYVRHIKGMVEDITAWGLENIMLNNLGTFHWRQIPWVDSHSMPLSIMFKDECDLIDWIPADGKDPKGEQLLENKLAKYGITINWEFDVDRYESSEYKKKLFFQLLKLSSGKEEKFRYFCRDWELYERAVKNHNVILHTDNGD
jgi:hypothetical protein